MSTTASVGDSPGLTYLTQLLATSTGLSGSQIQSMLQEASPEDIVQLSDQALDLQSVDALFSLSPPANSDSIPDSILANLAASEAPSNRVASYQAQLQAQEVQSLFGTTTTSGASGTTVDTLG